MCLQNWKKRSILVFHRLVLYSTLPPDATTAATGPQKECVELLSVSEIKFSPPEDYEDENHPQYKTTCSECGKVLGINVGIFCLKKEWEDGEEEKTTCDGCGYHLMDRGWTDRHADGTSLSLVLPLLLLSLPFHIPYQQENNEGGPILRTSVN